MENIDYKDLFISYLVDIYLDASVEGNHKSIADKMSKVIQNKENEIFVFNEDKKIKIYGSLYEEISILNDKVFFIYKDVSIESNNDHRISVGLVLLFDNCVFDIYTDLGEDFSTIGNEEKEIIFDCVLLHGENDILEDEFSVERAKEIIGLETYQKFMNYFLKEENLLIKNSIYKIY